MNAFQNFIMQKAINSSDFNSFNWYNDTNNITFYVSGNTADRILVFDENWVSIASKNLSGPAYIIFVNDTLYVSADTGIYNLDKYLNIINQYTATKSSKYRGIYYSPIENSIFVANFGASKVDVFDLDLNLNNSLNLFTYKPFSIQGLDKQIFVGDSYNGVIILIEKKIIIKIFQACGGISTLVSSIIFDQFGYMATTCFNNYAYLYSANGTYTSLNISTQPYPFQISFSYNGHLAIVSYYRVTIYY